jgi:Tol biopolymer transport system component
MKKSYLILLVFIGLLLAACAQTAPAPTEPPAPTDTPLAPTVTLEPTEPPAPTDTPIPTDTPPPPPTDTPVPTDTPEPTEPPPPTDTPVPTDTPEPSPTPVPAGPRLVFVSNRGGDPNKLDLFILNLDSMEITPLNTGFDAVALPKWSPDGSKILFAVKDVWNLYTIDADGTNLTQVTDFRSNNGDWSPDGTQIVFQSDHQNEPQDTPDIYRIDVTGENLVEILDDPAVPDFNPRWSADGSQIMFISGRAGKYQVFLMNADGSDVVQVTAGGSSITNASLSPDGNRIAFTYPQGGKFTDLYVIGKDGSPDSVVRLTQDATFDDGTAWSPDGEKIFFYSDRSGNYDLWMINADGTNPVQLTDDEYYDVYPDYWSP